MTERESAIIADALRCYLQEQRTIRDRLAAETRPLPYLYEIKVLIDKFTTRQEQAS